MKMRWHLTSDSRCYRLRRHEFVQITKEHSFLQEQIDAGRLTDQQAQTSLHKHLITRALGIEEVVLAEINEYQVAPGDVYLMCSDGLSDIVQSQEVADIIGSADTLLQRAEKLVKSANDGGGHGDVSVLLIQAQSTKDTSRRQPLPGISGQ